MRDRAQLQDGQESWTDVKAGLMSKQSKRQSWAEKKRKQTSKQTRGVKSLQNSLRQFTFFVKRSRFTVYLQDLSVSELVS
jgi:hypothetical protein